MKDPIMYPMYEPNETLDELERHLHEQLVHIQQQYQRAVEPIIRDLVLLRDARPVKYYLAPGALDPSFFTGITAS